MKITILFLSILITQVPAARAESILASMYGLEACEFNPHRKCPTASGKSLYELERKKVPYCASFEYPIGAELELTNSRGVSARCVVLDRGPHPRLKQKLDLSRRVFTRLGREADGRIKIQVRRVK